MLRILYLLITWGTRMHEYWNDPEPDLDPPEERDWEAEEYERLEKAERELQAWKDEK